jgi:hypothetical protein
MLFWEFWTAICPLLAILMSGAILVCPRSRDGGWSGVGRSTGTSIARAGSLLGIGRLVRGRDPTVHPNDLSMDLLTIVLDGGGMGATISHGGEPTDLSV